MDLALVMNELRPGENVAPDLSSYEAMAAKWRGSGDCPTKAECVAKWNQIKDAVASKDNDRSRREEYLKRGLLLDLPMALYEKIQNNNDALLLQLKPIIEQINATYPKK